MEIPGFPLHRKRSVSSAQRFNRRRPCPVCGGHPALERGKGLRCSGYYSADRAFAHCSREERAGRLEQEAGGTYAHMLAGECACGDRHDDGPPPVPEAAVPLASAEPGHQVAAYVYRSADGADLFRVLRYEPKAFRQQRADGRGGWEWTRDGVELVPYRLPELGAAGPGEVVYLVEGEKDANAIAARGGVATTLAGGASAKPTPGQLAPFKDRIVALLPDNDDVGRNHMAKMQRALHEVARWTGVIEIEGLPEKGDVSDWFAAGHTLDELRTMVEAAREREYRAVLVCVGDVEAERVRWLWSHRLAFGKVALAEGNPGQGKSTLTLDLAARLSTGRPMPGETEPQRPRGVVLLSLEDAIADTIRPRLEAAGADVRRIHSLTGVRVSGGEAVPVLPKHLDVVEEACRRVDAGLVVIDPFMAYLDAAVDSHKDQHVRGALAPLAALAERLGVAVLIVRHLNKCSGGDPMYRGGGSIGIIGAARSGLVVGRDPTDEQVRVVALGKSNNAPDTPALRFRLEGTPSGVARIEWLGECALTAADVLGVAGDGERSSLNDAQAFLTDQLAKGAVRARDAIKEARDAGITEASLNRARGILRVVSRKVGFAPSAYWAWSLPDGNKLEAAPAERATPELFSRELMDDSARGEV